MTALVEGATNGHKEEEEEEEWDENEEWQWETESEEEEAPHTPSSIPGAKKPQPNIQIEGSLVKIDRKQPVDWSEDEFDDDDDKSYIPPPPPPPPPPPSDCIISHPETTKKRSEALDNLKKKPAKTPDWSDLMKEIGGFKYGHKHLLNKVICNDRSKPYLSKTKVEGQFVFDSEKTKEKKSILKDIKKGVRLKHVKTNDRSKPNLRGIRNFRRQITKEDEQMAEMDALDENEEFIKLRDDLESTKQLLELEVRSKSLLEKDNKRMQSEMERLRMDLKRSKNEDINGDTENEAPSRRSSIQMKRRSIIRMISENEALAEEDESKEDKEEEAEDELLRQEAEEARLLAEEWENKYKEMQRQMKEIEGGSGKHHKKSSTVSEPGNLYTRTQEDDGNESEGSLEGENSDDEDWMSKREVHTLKQKLKTVHDKREILNRERNLLNERIGNLIGSISSEVKSRQNLKKEIKDMNEAFKREIAEMCSDEFTTAELEDCYFSDEDTLVSSKLPVSKEKVQPDWEDEEVVSEEEEEEEETLSEIIQLAEDELEEEEIKQFQELFDLQKESDEMKKVKERLESLTQNKEETTEFLNAQIESQTANVHNMRKCNFSIKSKIDRLHDVLQYEKERHQDLKQELTRMLADIQ
ncbi:uncharacterized protein sals isoform X2 [Lepeophtheirus salmonis]|uniref:uncharacterized protein sals isoform X2 n=1 Tax=Lepeophtheirus salmonis TaxID=72036 RepID=UPI001AE7E8F6|nr:trichohyalin-like isoform X2 [Lepeophtheirus salmonis]